MKFCQMLVNAAGAPYAGIGSRETPANICEAMCVIACYLENRGMILRSGAASGADQAFERGVIGINKQIFLPWRKFENSTSPYYKIPDQAFAEAAKFHPRWSELSQGAKKLHARNVQQILGPFLDSPSRFVICWTRNGSLSGGTAQAMRIAFARKIPIFNLFDARVLRDVLEAVVT